MRYITGMNRDRDGYQVAGALAEVGALEALITDYYHGVSKPSLRALEHRKSELVDPADVVTVPRALAYQLVYSARKRIPGASAAFPSSRIDGAIASKIEDWAIQHPDAGKLIYSNYAYKAFAAPDSSEFNGLFQYHPGSTIIGQALAHDELADAGRWESEPEIIDVRRQRVYQTEISLASRVLCASNFTARGLIADGVARESIAVIPYGCPDPVDVSQLSASSRTLLFVGQGVQRKGLHLLAAAWRRTAPSGWRLRVVASRMDPEIARLLAKLPAVEISGAVDAQELERLYSTSDALVLPSLVEGFGLVLGEALSRGCRLIASTNTGLPDMRLDAQVARTVVAGDVQSLADSLGWIAETFDARGSYREHAVRAAGARSWENFRAAVRDSVSLPQAV